MAMNASEPTVSEQIEKLYKRLEDVYKQQEVYGLYVKQKFELMQSVIDQQEMQIAELTRRVNNDLNDETKVFIQSQVESMMEQQLEDIDSRLFLVEQNYDIYQDSD